MPYKLVARSGFITVAVVRRVYMDMHREIFSAPFLANRLRNLFDLKLLIKQSEAVKLAD